MSTNPTVTVLATGGTISMELHEGTGRRAPSLTAEDLVQRLDVHGVDLEAEQLYSISSHQTSFSHWHQVATRAMAVQQGGSGVVVVHGTDTMEEGAFFLAETTGNSDISVVGAMRPPGRPGEDGDRNLRDGVILAREARGFGTNVVMNRAILPAWDVTKADTVAVNAFGTRHGTRIATIHDGNVRLLTLPVSGNWLGELPPEPPRSDGILSMTLDADPCPRSFHEATQRARGLVIETMGAGSIPSVVRGLAIKAAHRIPVVLTSRSGSGPIRDDDDYPRYLDDLTTAGMQVEDYLSTAKARIRLALSMALKRPYVPFVPTTPPGRFELGVNIAS